MRGVILTSLVSLGAHIGVAALLLAPPWHADAGNPPPTAAGDTFELPAPDTAALPMANGSPSPDSTAEPAPSDEGDAPLARPPSPPAHGKPATRPAHAARPSAGRAEAAHGDPGSSGAAGVYGAVGVRSASDLATAFTRGFPQAASADPAWRTAGFGNAGEADVILSLSATGSIESSEIQGAASPALTSGIRRTLALIQGRSFIARGKVTRLHISARVAPDSAHDGLHGDVFAIGGGFAGGEGSAFFALAIGRRIDLRVRAK